MQDGRKESTHRQVMEAVVDYVHRLANGEFPEKITEAEIPDDLKPLVRTAALLGFQLEARERRHEVAVRSARRESKRLAREVVALKAEIARRPEPFEMTITRSVRDRILAFARAGVDVLLVGGQAAERSVVARMIHRESRRARAELVSFAANAPTGVDIDEDLFGVERRRGRARRVGAFQRADGGTLFIDEVSALGAGAQARLLRFLKDRDLLPVGAKRPVRVNVRVVLGLAEPLALAVQAARLRVDLARCLGDRVVDVGSVEPAGDSAANAIAEGAPANLASVRAEAEVAAIRVALRTCHGNRAAAARLLGISREGIRQKVKLYDIVI